MASSRTRHPLGPAVRGALRRLPQMDDLLGKGAVQAAAARHGRALVALLLRQRLTELRAAARRGALSAHELAQAVQRLPEWVLAEAQTRTTRDLVPVINATGVVLHTNLGRAPLPPEAIARVAEVAGHYSALEYDLGRGRRGSRASHLERLLMLLFPGRAFQVVNNNAAAMLLALNALALGREVVVSRGELVEIGGSFRVPEIMEKSGALLREVGTTNRTRLADYERAIRPATALLLKVHPSNYRVVGFTAEVPIADLAALARRRRIPLLVDQGSGNLADLGGFGVHDEATVHDVLRAGADLVCCSGDKLLGGPQAGLIIGKPTLVARLRNNPLARVLRPDKMIIAALETVLRSHLKGTAVDDLPVLRMIALARETIDARARSLVDRVGVRSAGALDLAVRPGVSLTGGGSAPGEGIPTALIAVRSSAAAPRRLEARLRGRPVPVICRVEVEAVLIDLRTVEPDQEAILEDALVALASEVNATA